MSANQKTATLKPDNTAHLISQARRAINAYLMVEMEKAGMQGFVPSHGDIITTLLKHDSISMSDLSASIQRDPSTVTSLVKKLEQQGFLQLSANPQDTRSRLVSLTERGRALKEEFYPISLHLAQTLWQDIEDDEREQFRLTLLKIIQNFQTHS